MGEALASHHLALLHRVPESPRALYTNDWRQIEVLDYLVGKGLVKTTTVKGFAESMVPVDLPAYQLTEAGKLRLEEP